eukprot:8960166-Ditylum_brightwellii.AAC.1
MALRISYPSEDILIWDDDTTGAFRQCELHPAIAQVFSFILELKICLPYSNRFGSNTSPVNWGPIRRDRKAIAQWHFSDKSFI